MVRPLLAMERPEEAQEPDATMLKALQDSWQSDWGSLDQSTFRAYSLGFYDGVFLLEVDLYEGMPTHAHLYFLYHGGSLFCLNGTSPPIHELNSKTRPLIRADNVLDYLAFFCFFVRGEEGPFLIVDRPDGCYVPDIPDKDALQAKIRSPQIWGQDENGDWRISALVYYANALFLADFLVHLEGMVRMEGDNPILTDLPCRVDAPLEFQRRNS